MAYSAVKNSGGLYEVSQDGNRIATGTSAVLGNYGLSETSLGSSAPAPTGIGATTSQPAAQASLSPAPQQQTPAAPNITINNAPQAGPQAQPQYNAAAQTAPQQQNSAPTGSQTQSQQNPAVNAQNGAPPSTNLQPGAQGQDVQALQNYLVQHGYLTPEQLQTGPGIYGPQTTSAVAKLQNDLGIQAGSGAGYYGPQTQQALAQKYQGLFDSVKNSQSPDTGADARSQMESALGTQNSQNNPVFNSLSSSMGPIMQSLGQVLQNINNPALTAVSLQQEYNQLRDQYKLPEMNAQLMNMQNIMNGTETDIRDEVTKAGGFATESQVQGIAATRNKVILKQYNALATQYSAAQTNVTAMMQYAGQDQSTSLQRAQITAGITESMASIQTQLMNMGMTMQNNARQAAQFNISQMGYKGLSSSLQGNPTMMASYESLLGLSPGTLSNPDTVASMDTYKDQQLAINYYKSLIAGYNAGYNSPPPPSPTNPTGTGQYGIATSTVAKITGYDPNMPLSQADPMTLVAAMIQNEGSSPKGVQNNPGNIKFAGLPGQINSGVKATDGGTFASYATPQAGQQAIANNIANAAKTNPSMTLGSFVDRYTNTAPGAQPPGQVGVNPVDPSTLVRPPNVSNTVPLSMSADDMTKYMQIQKSAYTEPGTHNVVAPGVGTYLQQSNGSYVLKSALPSSVEGQYQQIKQTIATAQDFKGSPTVTRKWTLSANSAISSFKDSGTYKVASNVAPYLAAIHAASANPGDKSISDFELLDSFVKAAKGGTGQVTDSQISVMLHGRSLGDNWNVLGQKLQSGGVLSPAQRSALLSLADSTYKENLTEFRKGYVQAAQAMQAQGIPAPFWRNLPDFSDVLNQ